MYDFDFTAEQITEAVDSWSNFTGFSGETCSKCKKTANVLNGPGWICACGHFNAQFFSGGPKPHGKPDLGPAGKTIRKGYGNSKKWQRIQNI